MTKEQPLKNKRAFVFELPWYKRIANHLNYEARFFIFFSSLLVACSLGLIKEGFRNNAMNEKKKEWISEEVIDLNNRRYNFLDEEEAPKVGIQPKRNADIFREQFQRMNRR